MTTMRLALPSVTYSATASSVRFFSVRGGVFSSTMRDSSWPILACLPALPRSLFLFLFLFLLLLLFLPRPVSSLRPLSSCGCPRWDLCLRPMVNRGWLAVRRERATRRVAVVNESRQNRDMARRASPGCRATRAKNSAGSCVRQASSPTPGVH